MVTALLASVVLAPVVHLEAKLPKTTFKRGEAIRIEVYAVNASNQELVMGLAGIGNFASGTMKSTIIFTEKNKPELNHYSPNMGQIMVGPTLHILEQDFVVIPPKGRKQVFFEEIEGEWKDGYTPWNAPNGIKPISIPARSGEYRYSFTYRFNRKDEYAALKKEAVSESYMLGDLLIPERRMDIVFEGNSKKLFDTAIEGKWSVSGSFKIASS